VNLFQLAVIHRYGKTAHWPAPTFACDWQDAERKARQFEEQYPQYIFVVVAELPAKVGVR
jgi:hypothetical protein